MSTAQKIRAWAEGGRRVELDAWPTPVPGLVVNRNVPEGTYEWCVSHMASGTVIAQSDDPEHALQIAIAMADVCDWTRPATELRRDPAIWRRWAEVTRAHNLDPLFRAIPGALLRAVEQGRVS
jgi:hypothetical protein